MTNAERKLIRLMAAVIYQSRDPTVGPGDVDGGWLQDKAEEIGVLIPVPVTEACSEGCPCSDYGFPTTCYRLEAMVRAAMDEATAD